MAITVVQHKFNFGSGVSSLNVTVTSTGAGNLLLAIVVGASGATPTGVTDGTTAFTAVTGANITGSGTFAGVTMDAYRLLSSNSGKTTITLNASGTGYLEMEVWEVSGWTTVAEDGAQKTATGGSTGSGTTCTGPAITTTGASGFIGAGCGTANGPINTAGNPKSGNAFTSGGDRVSSDGYVSLITSATGTYTPEWTNDTSNDGFLGLTVAFKETASGNTTIAVPQGSVGLTGQTPKSFITVPAYIVFKHS